MIKLADAFEGAVGEIVKTVSHASDAAGAVGDGALSSTAVRAESSPPR